MCAYQRGLVAGLVTLLLTLYVNDASQEKVRHRFFVSFPSGNQQTNSQPFLVAIPSGNVTVNVTVQMPYRNDLLRPITKTITDGRPVTILLPVTVRMTESSIQANGIEVLSTGDIALYVGSGSVGFFAQPQSALGDTYLVASSPPPAGHHVTFALLAVTNDTDVDVTIPPSDVNVTYSGVTYTHGDVVRITLQAYDTVQLASGHDLTGLSLRGTKPFALVSGLVATICACAPCGGYDVDQLLPTSRWGRHFATSSYSADGDTVRITANDDNTTVAMMTSHNTTYFRLSEGAYVDVRLPGDETNVAIFNATSDVHLQQLVAGHPPDTDSLFRRTVLTVPHTDEYSNRYTFYIDKSNQSRRFHVVFYSEVSDGLTLDGRRVIAITRSDVTTGTHTWQYVAFRVTMSRGVHVLHHTNASFGAMTSDDVIVGTTPHPMSTSHKPSTETSATHPVAYVAESDVGDDVINLHAAGGYSAGDKTGITRTVVAVIVSLSSAVFLVVVCILGFLAAEFIGRPDNFTHAKVTPFLDSPPHD